MLVSELIQRGATRFKDQTAILFGDEQLSFVEVDRLSNRFAHALIATGRAPVQGRVGLLMNNSLHGIPLDFACAKGRLTRVPLNARLSAREQAQMLTETDAGILIYGADLAERAAELQHLLPDLLSIPMSGGEQSLIALADRRPDGPVDRTAEPSDVVLALYTSGTTGVLKAAQHTQASWAAVAANILLNLVDVKPGDRMLHAASLIHASGTFVLPYWVRGGVAAVAPSFTAGDYCAAVARWRPKAINLVPTMVGMLLDMPGIEAADFSSIETIVYGASPMPRATLMRGMALWGPIFTQYYGQSEAPLCITVLSKEDHVRDEGAKLLACGRVSDDCEVMLMTEDGRAAPVGEPGEILVRAPFGMTGYFNAPELNASTLLPGGWIKTRDVGRFDEDGFLFLVDRTSDMIVSGGYNVYPREVEDVLASHPAVREVVVVGLPHDKWGEVVTAFVVSRDGADATSDALIEFSRASLAAYKVPKDVRFIAEIPKSPVGKLLRRAVRDPFWAGRDRRI
jgi:acyl-CoA synthetase (AMP-forming)/AMP-acid ligase II